MGIVFFCQSCGARFEVASSMAARRGRCKRCGQAMEIPRAEQLASMVAMPALAAGAKPAAVAARTSAASDSPSVGAWLKAAATNVGLDALSADHRALRPGKKSAPSALDDAEDSKPYVLATPVYTGSKHGGGTFGVRSKALATWRRETGMIQRAFRWLNESAYLISIPFIIILLFGIVSKSRSTALFGATFVVVLNLGRIVAGIANLAMVPLRDGLNSKKMKKPLRRVIEPVITIAIVVLMFTFIPWLSAGSSKQGSIKDRLRATATGLGDEMKGELGTTVERAKSLDVDKINKNVQSALKSAGPSADGSDASATPPGTNKQSAENAVRGVLKGVGERVRETVNEAQQQP
jgi:hypothetical protein